MFNNAQEFYEHLDDCVLRVVQQEEPSEAINEQHLAEVANDRSVLETLDRNMIPSGIAYAGHRAKTCDEDDEDENDDEEDEVSGFKEENGPDLWTHSSRNKIRSGKGSIKTARGNTS